MTDLVTPLVEGETIPSPQELVARAEAMIPVLRERSAATEELRRIPDETKADFIAAEFLRIAQPVEFGGMGYGLDVVRDVTLQIGRGCGSTAWMAGQWPGHNFMLGYFSREAQEEYWADTPDQFSSTASAMVKLDVKEEKGGARLSAHWRFSSGCDAAEWILGMTPIGYCLIPRSDFRIEDDWYVSGLRGTGSKSVIVDDVFVPAHRISAFADLASGHTYGATAYDSPFYKLPQAVVLPTLLCSSVLGMALGVLDIFEERALKRFDIITQSPAFERPTTQLRFAESVAEVRAAELLLKNVHTGMAERVQKASAEGRDVAIIDRAEWRRDVCFAAKLCVRATDRLVESGDSSSIFSDMLMQRWFRDVHAGALQVVLLWDEQAIQWSRVRWGLEPHTVTI